MTNGIDTGSPNFAIFRAWVGAQQARAATTGKRRDRFSDETARIYASLWRGWLQWLTARGREWTQACSADVRAFLEGPAPSPADRRTRAPIEPKKMARYTQQRYWRVLQAIYAHAVVNGLLPVSPCSGIVDKPRMTAGAQTRQLLPPGVLGLLREPMELERFLPLEHASHWWVLRDRAAVAIAAHCGLAAGELIALRGIDLRAGSSTWTAWPKQLPAFDPDTAWVDVPARGNRPARSVRLPGTCLAVVEAWLARRSEVLQRHAPSLTTGSQPRACDLAQAPLLLSREAPAGAALPALDAPTLYHSFRKCLVAAIEEAGHRPGDGYVARGPSILRNSVIAAWAKALGPEVAAQLAGLKPASLRAEAGGKP